MTKLQLKNNLHKLVDEVGNNQLLEVVYQLLYTEKIKSINGDWWDTLSAEQQLQIEKSLKDLENGKGIPHAEVMKKYKGKYF